jgi:hypothetical protein
LRVSSKLLHKAVEAYKPLCVVFYRSAEHLCERLFYLLVRLP